MLFTWNDETMGYMLDAAEYTGFYRNLAALLLPFLAERGSLCDMGCGMALTDLALAGEIETITCVDVNADALSFAQREAARRGAANLSFVCSDGKAAQGRWDTVMALFHGRVDDITVPYLSKAWDRLLLVTHGVGVKKGMLDCANAEETAAWLDAGGWVYERQDAELEFGQPHRSVEEAVASTAAFKRGIPKAELEDYVRARLVPTGRVDFPYYTPKTRSFTIFSIPRRGNEGFLEA